MDEIRKILSGRAMWDDQDPALEQQALNELLKAEELGSGTESKDISLASDKKELGSGDKPEDKELAGSDDKKLGSGDKKKTSRSERVGMRIPKLKFRTKKKRFSTRINPDQKSSDLKSAKAVEISTTSNLVKLPDSTLSPDGATALASLVFSDTKDKAQASSQKTPTPRESDSEIGSAPSSPRDETGKDKHGKDEPKKDGAGKDEPKAESTKTPTPRESDSEIVFAPTSPRDETGKDKHGKDELGAGSEKSKSRSNSQDNSETQLAENELCEIAFEKSILIKTNDEDKDDKNLSCLIFCNRSLEIISYLLPLFCSLITTLTKHLPDNQKSLLKRDELSLYSTILTFSACSFGFVSGAWLRSQSSMDNSEPLNPYANNSKFIIGVSSMATLVAGISTKYIGDNDYDKDALERGILVSLPVSILGTISLILIHKLNKITSSSNTEGEQIPGSICKSTSSRSARGSDSQGSSSNSVV